MKPLRTIPICAALALAGACFDPSDNGDDEIGDATDESGSSSDSTSEDTDTDTTTASDDTDTSSSDSSSETDTDTETTAAPACGDGSVDPGELCLGDLVEYPLGQDGLRAVAGPLLGDTMGVAVVSGGEANNGVALYAEGLQLSDPQPFPIASPSVFVTGGDVDNDGDFDLLASGELFTVLLNDGDGGWTPIEVDPGFFPGGLHAPKLGQLDGSAPLDIVYGEGYNTQWIRGSNQGGWSPGPTGNEQFSGGDSWVALTEFGFDGDGFTDVLVSSAFIPEIHFASGQGNGSFTQLGVTQACPGNTCEIVELHSADLDGDENPDIVASLDMGLSVIMGKGDGTFDNFELTLLPGADVVDSGDVNGDGNVDLLVANSQDGALRLYLGDGTGGLDEPVVFQTPATELRSAVIADLDQNGAPELLTTYTYNGGGWVGVVEANP